MRIRFHRAGPETQQAEGRARWLRPESSRGDLRRTGAAGACAGKPIDKGGRTNVRQPLSVALLAALAACKSKEPPPTSAEPTPPSPAAAADAAAPPADWAARCEAALAGAPKLRPVRRVEAIIDGCRPCGDWAPLLRWSTLPSDGGPKLAEIEAAMDACQAYCKPEAKIAFLGALEAARGKHTNKPWRELGEVCRDQISARGDFRYMSAPFFALDRIARGAAAHPRLGPLLDAIELPLPPLSITGGAFVLAPSPALVPEAGPVHVTVSTTEITVGLLPRAKLGAAGVTVDAGEALYPGASVTPKALAAALDKLAAGPDARIALIAPKGMAARRLIDVVAAAGPHKLVLAAAAAGGPEGWNLPGVVPVVLSAKEAPGALRIALGESADDAIRELQNAPAPKLAAPPAIAIADKATVEGLAKLLGALVHRDLLAASLVAAPGRARP